MNHLVDFKPDHGVHRQVEVEQEYTCQRWPVGTELIHKISKRPVEILELEFTGFWLGHTARFHRNEETGRPLERYLILAMYRVRVPSLHEERMLGEHEMRPA